MDNQDSFNPFMAPSSIEASRQQQQRQSFQTPVASFPSGDVGTTGQQIESPFFGTTSTIEQPVQDPLSPQYRSDQSSFAPNVQYQPQSFGTANIADSEYQRQMQELRRREEELAAREKEVFQREQSRLATSTVKQKNFPPLPSWFCVKPCFYINIKEEIPTHHVKLIKFVMYYWFLNCATLAVNFIAACCYIGAHGNESTLQLVLAIFLGIAFVFLCFYTQFFAAYKAIRSDSHFNYVMYFVSTAIAIVVNVVQLIGIEGSGWCGIIVLSKSFDLARDATSGAAATISGIISIICSLGFLGCAVINILLLKKVHTIYRTGSKGTIQQSATTAVVSNFAPALMNQAVGPNFNMP